MKLTLVSVVFSGIRVSRFVTARYENGRAVISEKTIQDMISSLNIPRGSTLTIG